MKIKRRVVFMFLFLSITLFSACRQDDQPPTISEPVSEPVTPAMEHPPAEQSPGEPSPDEPSSTTGNLATGVLISELLSGVPGANNHEFIELYNATAEAVNLDGYTLAYLTRADQEESLLYTRSWLPTNSGTLPGLKPTAYTRTSPPAACRAASIATSTEFLLEKLSKIRYPSTQVPGTTMDHSVAGQGVQ